MPTLPSRCTWPGGPVADQALIDEDLSADMAQRACWSNWGVRPGPPRTSRPGSRWRGRWPAAPGFASLPPELRAQVAEELNVHALETMFTVDVELVDYSVKPNFKALGRRFGNQTPAVARAITSADAAALAAAAAHGGDRGGHGGRRIRAAEPGRGDRDPDAEGGLDRRHRRRRDGGDGGDPHPRTAPRGPGPGSDPAHPGRAEERRARRHRPDRAVVGGERPGAFRRATSTGR